MHYKASTYTLKMYFFVQGQYSAVAGSPTGVAPSPQHQMPITSQSQPEMYMSGVQMNGSGMGGTDYQTGSNVGANVQSQVKKTILSWVNRFLLMKGCVMDVLCILYIGKQVPLVPIWGQNFTIKMTSTHLNQLLVSLALSTLHYISPSTSWLFRDIYQGSLCCGLLLQELWEKLMFIIIILNLADVINMYEFLPSGAWVASCDFSGSYRLFGFWCRTDAAS